ncbi:hypothetical protein [Janthinobacterium sp. RB2R34]|uniref:hypothetical protein n=1 Tax=Janthinobacterium sp. RB2R34 TaxID=3424193 RepID=UPI003F209F82
MNRYFHRHFVRSLLWLLIAVLPLPGFAAAMRSCCLPQESVVEAVVVKIQAQHCHAMADMTATMPAHEQSGKTMAHGHECGSACTFVATAPPPMSALQSLSLRAPPPPAVSPVLFSGHIPPGPERPPSSIRSA